MAPLPEDLVLRQEHAVDAAHQAATLAVEIRIHLLLKGSLVEIAGTNGDTYGLGLLLSLARDVLVDGVGRVNAAALSKERPDRPAGALGSHEDHVDVLGDVDLGEVLEHGRESVGEIECLPRR